MTSPDTGISTPTNEELAMNQTTKSEPVLATFAGALITNEFARMQQPPLSQSAIGAPMMHRQTPNGENTPDPQRPLPPKPKELPVDPQTKKKEGGRKGGR